jgi:ferredoxin-nitrite reductase
MELSGLKHLSEEARARATAKKTNPFEKIKVKKCGSRMWEEVHELSALLKQGTHTFEDLDLDDVDVRLKWAGLFHRKKRTPGRFMMRLKVRTCAAPRRATPAGRTAVPAVVPSLSPSLAVRG